jgi:hypothetical protein
MSHRIAPLAAFVLVLCLPRIARAQTAAVTGTVTDVSGALVPHARVTARNTATNVSRSVDTDETGTYRLASLSPEFYDVFFEKDGFKTVQVSHVQLTVGQTLNLDARLAPSPLSEHVLVTGEAVAPINLNDAQIGNIVDSRQITDLPLILRDPYGLVLLSPGVIQSNSLLGGFSVNGSRERNNNFLLDGVDNNDAEIPGLPGSATVLNPDSTQEFRVISNNYLPEFGRNTGGVIDVVTRGGTNSLHGDTYWFGRYDDPGARDFFNHQTEPATGQTAPKDFYVRNIFGASAGGPIVPDRTFWFVNYEGQRFITTLTSTAIVPTAAFKSGLFTFQGQTVDLSSPQNIFGLPLDPTIQKILALYPAPNGPMVDDIRGILFFPSRSVSSGDNVTARVDHNFTSREVFSARYTFNRLDDNNFHHEDFLPGLGGVETNQRIQNLSLHLTSIFHGNMTNDLSFGGNRINLPFTCTGQNVINGVGSQVDPFGRGRDFSMPGISGFGCLFLGDSNGSQRFSGTYTSGDAVTWVSGRHSVKTGFEFHDVYANGLDDFASRSDANFQNFSNFGIPAFATGTMIDNNALLQDMVWSLFGVEGIEDQAQFFNKQALRTPNDPRGFRQREMAAFAQDSYKILPNLTVSYGLRYQFNGVPFEQNNVLSTLLVPPSGTAPFNFVVAGNGPGAVAKLYTNDWKDFEPRFAVAWDPFKSGKTSIRAGYGIFHDRVFGQLIGLMREDPPFQQIALVRDLNPMMGSFPTVTATPLPGTLVSSPIVNNEAGIFPFVFNRNLRMPYSQNWNVGIQREPVQSLLIEVNYVGTKGTRLLREVDGNPPQPALVQQLLNMGVNPALLQFANLWFGAESGALPFDPVNNNAFFQAGYFDSEATSTYNALQANVTKRMSHGFAVQGAYTWSHAIDNASDPLVPGAGNQPFPRNSFNLQGERGNSDFDVTHRLVMNYTWDVPVGHIAASGEGFSGKFFKGWQVSGINTFSSGLPYDIFTNVDSAHTGLAQRPDFNPSGTLVPVIDPRTQTGPNLGLFSDPPFGRGGSLGRNTFRGPGINNWDMVLQKATRLSERFSLDMRAEAYNLFNRTQFNQPGNLTANPGTFGQSTSEVGRPDGTTGARQIQFGLKFHF